MSADKREQTAETPGEIEWKEGNIDGVNVREAARHCDKRGWLAEIFRQDSIETQIFPAMGYVSVTVAGACRGPHEHVHQTDFFAFLGPGSLKLRLWDFRKNSETIGNVMTLNVGEVNPVVVVVPPGVVHGYMNTSSEDAYVMNFPNRLYAGQNKQEEIDEIRHEDNDSSPFTMKD